MVNTHIDHGYDPIGGILKDHEYQDLSHRPNELIEWKGNVYIQTMYKKPTKKSKPAGNHPGFTAWWKAYPKKSAKKKALQIWNRIKPDAAKLLADVLNRNKNDHKWVSGFPPEPTTYLNQERWNDEVTAIPVVENKIVVPYDDAMLEAFAVEQGMHDPGMAPIHLRNSYEYRKWIEGKL